MRIGSKKVYDISQFARHGDDVYIAAQVVIKRPHLVSVGSHIAVDEFFYCTTRLLLGSYIHIGPAVTVIGGAESTLLVEDFCTIAAGCRVVCASDEYLGHGLISPAVPDEFRDNIIRGQISMRTMSALGSNVVITPGITLGEGAVAGANSYVNKDIPSWEIWAGSPVHFIRKRPSSKMIKYAREILG